jgi:hypothetical protein
MYSMSTETVETLTHFRGNDVAFLPLASRVFYEFIEETKSDQPQNLLNPDQTEPGKTYSLVVSDPYGLRRYQTGDVFLCRGRVNGVPDLTFLRRSDLGYSFTGEKLTATQINIVFERLRAQFPELDAEKFLTCVPSHPTTEPVPHYKVLLISHIAANKCNLSYERVAAKCDELLSEINCEYKNKRVTGRLGPVRLVTAGTRTFAERFAENGSWETQFKFLPLYRRTWESLTGTADVSPTRPSQ